MAEVSKDAQAQTSVAAKPVLTDELFAELSKDPPKLHDQPPEIKAAVRARLSAEPGDPGEALADPPVVEKSAEAKAEAAKLPTPEEIDAKRLELKNLSDDANRIEQKIKAAKDRKARAEQEREEWKKANPEKKPEDYLDESHQSDTAKRLRSMEEELAFLRARDKDREQEEIETLTRSHQTTKEQTVYTELETLQADPRFAAIKTSKSVAKLNAEYAGWLDNLVSLSGLKEADLDAEERKNAANALRNRAMDRYQNDSAFKESVKVAPPEELDKLNLILTAVHRAGAGGSVKAHLFDILDNAGVLGEAMQRGQRDAAREAANSTAAAMINRNKEIQTLSPDDGTSRPVSPNSELTPQTAAALMQGIRAKQDRRENLTAEDKKTIKRVAEYSASLRGG